MLNLENAIKNAVERICRDRNEDDKIYIHVSDLAREAIRQHAQEINKLKEKLNAMLQDFYQYVQDGKEICAFCLYDYKCEPGATICGATYKGFKWRGLSEEKVEHDD